ncbi:MAG: cytochrome c oxidase subunit 3 [Cycloclasticus sp.]|nr:cytochrome c oxidase subunit 3 [Cycloclasticus sp.]MBQ0790704.1 cytochrome c oxidase subunit 3 [Cycloclasticus sp.]
MSSENAYYVPHDAKWPIVGSIGLTLFLGGFAGQLNGNSMAANVMIIGFLVLVYMMFGWFGDVIDESESGTYKKLEDVSFRMGMIWFIFSEVMFFAAFFGALYYIRVFSVPWLAGEGSGASTNEFIWSGFEAVWPTNGPAAVGGEYQKMGAWGLPAINTFILLISGATVTWAHWGLVANNRKQLIMGLAATVLLGFIFVGLQVLEYSHGYNELNLTMGSGVYGSTFYMLTGFHGFHVTVGAIMLLVMLIRSIKGHFTPENHFAFEAAAWYWHFVDVVWLGLFIFVYWL